MDAFETPALLVDADRLQRNIQTMQARCDAAGVALRPHIKTHKSPRIAALQVEAGAQGIACQKVSEAEVFAAAGFGDILIPYTILGDAKTRRLADLAYYNRVTVSADSAVAIHGLNAAAERAEITLRVMIELATDIARAGAPVEAIVGLAEQVERADHLHFAGLLVYPMTVTTRPLLQEALALLDAASIGVDSVSGGGIASAAVLGDLPELTEVRIGTYVFNDLATLDKGFCTIDDCALTIRTTVVSRPTAERAILDAGSKTISSDHSGGVYGRIVEYPAARLYKLNEEHGYVDLSACDAQPDVGDVVHVIPAHVCTAVNLHERLFLMQGDTLVETIAVAARGKVW